MSQNTKSMSEKPKTSLKVKVQKFGTFLSGMIMPNIAAIIAWGLITAIFLTPGGWFPNAMINKLSSPALTYLLPLLIGYTGGKMVYEDRGAVVGAIATLGSVVGSNVPMFIGAMIMGPLGGWCMKKIDNLFQSKIKSGFEMIYNNFSAGILGMILAIVAAKLVGPLVVVSSGFMATGVDWIISVHALPLANLFIEPAKVLFLNNAIGNGILVPLGIQQVTNAGKSVLFLLESNPGPGIGVLLAFCLFGKGSAKSSAPGAAIIQFFGGIHEIYFPYIMMKPSLFLAVIGGGITGTFTFQLLGAGLKAAASPGSIISILLMTPKDSYIAVLSGILSAAIVSFLISSIILKRDKSETQDDNFASKQAQVAEMKSISKGNILNTNTGASDVINYADVQKVIFACDAGMGSSAMGASLLRDKFKKAGLQDISVTNVAIRNLKDESGLLVVTQEELQERAQQKAPHALSIAVQNFMNSPRYEEIVEKLKNVKETTDQTRIVSKEDNVKISNVDFERVHTIYVAHDKAHTGSATMFTSMLHNKLKQANKQTRFMRSTIDDLKDEDDSLIVSTPTLTKKLMMQYKNAQFIDMSGLDSTKLNEIVQSVK